MATSLAVAAAQRSTLVREPPPIACCASGSLLLCLSLVFFEGRAPRCTDRHGVGGRRILGGSGTNQHRPPSTQRKECAQTTQARSVLARNPPPHRTIAVAKRGYICKHRALCPLIPPGNIAAQLQLHLVTCSLFDIVSF